VVASGYGKASRVFLHDGVDPNTPKVAQEKRIVGGGTGYRVIRGAN